MSRLCRVGWVLAVWMVLMVPGLAAQAGQGRSQAGRYLEPGSRWRFTFNIGDRSPISGGVQESIPLSERFPEASEILPESFTLAEFDLTESDTTYGLSLEYQWKWITLFVDATRLETRVTGVAPRSLFVGVKTIVFGGEEFTFQVIPEGSGFDISLDMLVMNIRTAFTPWTFNAGGSAEFVPWVFVGLFTLGGQVDIDAGLAIGIQSSDGFREYVVGGSGSGDAVAFAPEVGIGGELKFRTGERSRLIFQGNFSIFQFSSGDLGIAKDSDNLDLDYQATDLKVFYEIPMSERVKFVVGAQYRVVDITGKVGDRALGVEDIEELADSIGRTVDFRIETALLNLGLRW